MKSSLLEIFLNYCKNGIMVESRVKELNYYSLSFNSFNYIFKDGDFIIYNNENSIVISDINKKWIVEEYNTYIKLYNKSSIIYIREM